MLCTPIPSFMDGIIEPNKLINKSKLTKDVITRTTNDIIHTFSFATSTSSNLLLLHTQLGFHAPPKPNQKTFLYKNSHVPIF